MNADQTLRGEAHDLVLHSGLSGVTGRCTCGAWSGGGRRELPSRVAHQWDAEHLTTLPLEQIDAHGSSVEYQPAEPETASERPNQPGETGRASDPRHDPIGTVRIGRDGRAVVKVSMGDETGKGQHVWVHVTQELEQRWFHHNEVAGLASERPDAGRETAYPHEWPAGYASLAAYEQQIGAARVANQRASSWWEAAKEFSRDMRRARKAIDRQVLDVANAMARNAEFRARVDAAEAARDEAIEMVKTCTGHPDRALPAVPSHPELIQRANAERDEAREKLDAVRSFIAEREQYITAIKNCPAGNTADYNRWQGHAGARRELAALLDAAAPAALGDVIKCERCGQQSRSISKGCSNCEVQR